MCLQVEEDSLRFDTTVCVDRVLHVLKWSKEELVTKSQFVRKYVNDNFTLDSSQEFVEDVRAFQTVVDNLKHFYLNFLFGYPGSWFDSVPHYRYHFFVLIHQRIKNNQGQDTLKNLSADKQFLKTCVVEVICERDWKNSRCIKPFPELRDKFSGHWSDIWSSSDFDFNFFCNQVSSHLWFVKELVVMECDSRRKTTEMLQVQERSVYWCNEFESQKEENKRLKISARQFVNQKNQVILDLQEQVAALHGQNEALSEQNAALNEQVAELLEQNAELNEQNAALIEQVSELEAARVEKVTNQDCERERRLQLLEEEKATLADQLSHSKDLLLQSIGAVRSCKRKHVDE